MFPPLLSGNAGFDNQGIVLYDHDLYGTETGNPNRSDSDYIFQYNGTIYFLSDSETLIPPAPPAGINWVYWGETGNWQDASAVFGFAPGTFLVASNVPEPATWAMMLAGFAVLGFAGHRAQADGGSRGLIPAFGHMKARAARKAALFVAPYSRPRSFLNRAQ